MRPLIGITCDSETRVDSRGCPATHYLCPAPYINAICQAGGEPIILPHDPSCHAHAAAILAPLSGLLLTGGDFDVPPGFYHASNHALLGRLNMDRSHHEKNLLSIALQRNLPVLGICGGMQLLNVVTGGTLHQDLSLRPQTSVHEQPGPRQKPFHRVHVAAGSLLQKITKTSILQVNSTHHQVIHRLGEQTQPCATAPDGVIEAIEITTQPFAVGVQWHPELLETEVEAKEQQKIYAAFIKAATKA